MIDFNSAGPQYNPEKARDAPHAAGEINGHAVSFDIVKARTRGREIEIARHLGVECSEETHSRCPLSEHPDNHPSFRAWRQADGTIKFICSASCPYFFQERDVIDL